jgi:hypothetical protein
MRFKSILLELLLSTGAPVTWTTAHTQNLETGKPVALAHLIEEPMEFWPVPASAGGLLTVDALATSGFQRSHLGGGILVVGGDSGLAYLHCSEVSPIESIMQYLYATHKFGQRRWSAGCCKIARLRNAPTPGLEGRSSISA